MPETSADRRIKETDIGKGTFAARDFKKEEVIFPLEGVKVDKATKYTIQTDINEHIIPDFGKYLNHSCNPNCYLDYKEFVFRAIKDIKENEELQFNYNTTEYDMANPFECNCKSENCYGTIKGYKYLNEEQKQKIKNFIPKFFV